MANSLDRIPPNAIPEEMAVLGAMMLDQEAASTVFGILDDTCFFRDTHQKVFRAAQKLFKKNDPIDLYTVAEVLNAAQNLEEIGGVSFLAEIVGSVASPAHAEHHSRIVLRKSVLRKFIHLCTKGIDTAYTEPDDIDGMLLAHETELLKLGGHRGSRMQGFGWAVVEIVESMNAMKTNPGRVSGVPTGFSKLDDILAGWQKGDYILVAGRPSNGKTTFCLNTLRYAAFVKHIPVGLFSMEARKNIIGIRMACMDCGVDSKKVRNGHASQAEAQKFLQCLTGMANMPLVIDDSPGLNLMELKSRCNQMVKNHGTQMIVVDYIGLMNMDYRRGQNQQQAMADLSRSLKGLAKDLDVPLIVLVQLSREVEKRGGRPNLSDLKDSGALEADADVVIFVHWVGKHKPDSRLPDDLKREIIVAKQRNGETGIVELDFAPSTGRFTERTYKNYAEPANVTGERNEDPYR
jgi:replicative DNA helicase